MPPEARSSAAIGPGFARRASDGVPTAPILPALYESPPEIEWRDPANWKMVTPNDGRSITVQRLIPDYHAAVEAGEEELRRSEANPASLRER